MPCMWLPVLTDFLDSLEAQIPELQAVMPSLPAIPGLYVFVCAVLFDVLTRKKGGWRTEVHQPLANHPWHSPPRPSRRLHFCLDLFDVLLCELQHADSQR